MVGLLFLPTGCGRNAQQTPTPVVTEAATSLPAKTAPPSPTSEPIALIDSELLGGMGFSAKCEHPDDAGLSCKEIDSKPNLELEIHAGTYARFSLSWDQESESSNRQSLSGHETLTLRATRSGKVTPNLYLIDDSDKRIFVRLAASGLKEGQSEIHIPLTEIRDDDGNKPDFSTVHEIQIVFEWADMSGSLTLESLRFDSVWREELDPIETLVSAEEMAELSVPDGFQLLPIAADLQQITQIVHDTSGNMLVSQQNGRVWQYTDNNKDGVYEQRHLYASGLLEVVGLLHDPTDGAIWMGGRGQLYRTTDTNADGVADQYKLVIDGLPWGRHQNNGLIWNPVPDPFTGEEEQKWIYFGLGSTGDLEIGGEYNATILRFPRNGSGQESLEVVSRGNRNPYALAWGQVDLGNGNASENLAESEALDWQLFASENGPDFNDAPDEVSHIRWQHHYGFPEKYGPSFDEPATELDGLPYSGSLYAVTPHASASGLTYIQNSTWPAAFQTLYVGLFGQVFSEKIVGHTVDRIVLTPVDSPTGITFKGEPETFLAGLDRPLPLAVDPNGDMLIGDYATGIIYHVSYVGE